MNSQMGAILVAPIFFCGFFKNFIIFEVSFLVLSI